MTLDEYVAYFRQRGDSLPEKDREVAALVVRQEARLRQLLERWGKGMNRTRREDLLQAAMQWTVEGVRWAEGLGANFHGPLQQAWDERVMAKVHAALCRERTRHDSARDNETPFTEEEQD